MQFFQWLTDYQEYKRKYPKRYHLSYEEYREKRLKEFKAANIPPAQIVTENTWLRQGSPYYNIHPELVSKLCKVDLTKIPSTLFKMPHNLTVMNIRFCQAHPEFTLAEGKRLRNSYMPSGAFLHGIMMIRSKGSEEPIRSKKADDWIADNGVLFLLDFNLINPESKTRQFAMFAFSMDERLSLEESLKKTTFVGSSDDKDYNDIICNSVRLAVTIGFLSDNPVVCEADVLNNDKQKFLDADDAQREIYAAKARRKGKYGYNVGTDLMFVG